jgi:predicted HTH domain antitoxin
LEVHLAPLDGAPQETGGCQQLQLALYRPHGGTCLARDLPQVVGLVRVAEEPPEDTPTGAPEKQRRRIEARSPDHCSHNEYKSTQTGNMTSTFTRWVAHVRKTGVFRIAIAVEAYRTGALTDSQVRRLLGLESRFQVHALLKEHHVPLQYTAADLEDDLRAQRELGILPSR